jgi:hypothetical protein
MMIPVRLENLCASPIVSSFGSYQLWGKTLHYEQPSDGLSNTVDPECKKLLWQIKSISPSSSVTHTVGGSLFKVDRK